MRIAFFLVLLLPITACNTSHDPETSHFDNIKDLSSLKITLDRSECFGICPSYIVEIGGDGTVAYCGESFVEHLGDRTKVISQKDVRTLFNKIMQTELFNLTDGYFAGASDMPTYQIRVTFDGKSKLLVDYAGQMVGMPEFVTELEESIDEVAGTRFWIGNVQEYVRSRERPVCLNRLESPFSLTK